jgi:tyrosyl-tRNA synthetase
MSKSLGNHIGINDPPNDMFGKLMSIPDTLIIKYFTLLTDVDSAHLMEMDRQIKTRMVNPRDAKADLAAEIVRMYHSPEAAQRAREAFFKQFSQRQPPSDMPTVNLQAGSDVDVIELIVNQSLTHTKNEARRLLRQGAVRLDGVVLKTPTFSLAEAEVVLQVGTRYYRKLIPTR